MGRKKNPFLVEKHEYKGSGVYNTYLREYGPWYRGRIYDYLYIYEPGPDARQDTFRLDIFSDRAFLPYDILLNDKEIEELGKENCIKYINEFLNIIIDGKKWVGFTEEEFKNFKRTKIIEHTIND